MLSMIGSISSSGANGLSYQNIAFSLDNWTDSLDSVSQNIIQSKSIVYNAYGYHESKAFVDTSFSMNNILLFKELSKVTFDLSCGACGVFCSQRTYSYMDMSSSLYFQIKYTDINNVQRTDTIAYVGASGSASSSISKTLITSGQKEWVLTYQPKSLISIDLTAYAYLGRSDTGATVYNQSFSVTKPLTAA